MDSKDPSDQLNGLVHQVTVRVTWTSPDKCVQLNPSLPSANYDAAVQTCDTINTQIFAPR